MTNKKILRLLKSSPVPLSSLQIYKQLNWWERLWIYIELSQLETEQLITSYFDQKKVSEREGYRRRFYCLTQAGKAQLANL